MREEIALTPEQRDTCPVCGEASTIRERRPLGRIWCANGHCWKQAYKLETRLDEFGRRETIKTTEYLKILEGEDAK